MKRRHGKMNSDIAAPNYQSQDTEIEVASKVQTRFPIQIHAFMPYQGKC